MNRQFRTALFCAVFTASAALFASCSAKPALLKTTLDPTLAPMIDPFKNALPDAWVRSNPGGGGAFTSIGAGPTGVILAGSDLSGAYISSDRGSTWKPIGFTQGLTNSDVSSVGFDTQNASIMYLGTEQGIFRSEDGGKSFHVVLDSSYILDIKFSSLNPNIGYAAWHPAPDLVGGQIYKTMDRGLTWRQVSVNLPDDLRIVKIVISPNNENILYLLSGGSRFACGANGLFQSEDGGVTWRRLGSDLPNIRDVALDSLNPNRLYVTTLDYVPDSKNQNCQTRDPSGGGLYESEDAGVHWTRLAARTGAIWLDPHKEKTIRLIDPGLIDSDPRAGTWESTDGGVHWTLVGSVANWDKGWSKLDWTFSESYNGAAHTFGLDLSDPNALFWVTNQFIYVTRDNGRHFENLYTRDILAPANWQSTGADNVVMFDISISPANPNDIYVGYYDIGCWHSPNGGLSWMNCNDSSSTTKFSGVKIDGWQGYGGNTTTILADPTRAGVVWSAQTSDLSYPFTLLRSNDGARSWQISNTDLPNGPLSGLSLDVNSPKDERTLFIAAAKNVYVSRDDGWSWSLSLNCNGCWYTAVDRFDGRLVYAGGSAGLFVSYQGGAPNSWTQINNPDFAGGGDNPWDGGSWSGISRIVPDPVTAGRVYVTFLGPGGGLYRSDDRGQTWIKLLADDFMRNAAVDPANPKIIYATSSSNSCCGGDPANSHGILRSMDAGQTWTQVNEGMAWPFAGPIAIDPADPSIVWVGSPGTGFQERDFTTAAP